MSAADIARAQQQVTRYSNLLKFAQSTGNPNDIAAATRLLQGAQADLASAQAAAAGTPPANSVNPAVSPVAAQVENSVANEYAEFVNQNQVVEPVNTFDDQLAAFLDNEEPDPIPQNEVPVQPAQSVGYGGGRGGIVEAPGERAAAIAQSQIEQTAQPVNPADDPFAEGADVNVTEETVVPIRQNRNPEPVLATDPVVNEIDEFGDIEARDLQNPENVIPTAVNDTQARQQQLVPDIQDQEDTVDFPVEESQAQINQAALDALRAQSAVQQNREPEGTGDWRVKLRLASGANYFYNLPKEQAGIMWPLNATDGIVFPYTPSMQILYAADYNQYHPTHSNYQHYFYKGSKVGEVVLTATFTAQDTEEANYLLAVIHFLKSASKMFYGQDAERGSPPPLLFLSGLGDYQFNEAPCVISQFNYLLPNDVDYIRANVQRIRGGTLQYDLRNKNTGAALTSLSSSLARIFNTPGLTIGAQNPTSTLSSQTANLSSDNATYVPTKIEMTITLLPVQNRLQVSEGFSLKEYANGSLIKGGFW